ncbi:MAG: extracellular solute-binding protein [Lachnospiraceae bacterium]|nr:extracellular solute-binding protein [Lachnospiraceae bacterium]
MKKKRVIIVSSVLAAVVVLAAALMLVHRRMDKEIVLEFGMFTGSNWDVESSTSFVIIDKAVERFEAEHPGVKIHYYSGVLKEDYSEWFSRKLLVGEAPDVFMVLSSDFNQLCSIGAMKNLDGLMKEDKDFQEEKFYSTALESGIYKNGQYALPYEAVPTLIFVNKTLLNKEGLTIPDQDWTWEKLYKICEAVTKDTDGDGKLDQFGTYNYGWLDAAYSNGVTPFAADGKSCDFTNPGMKEAFRFISRINDLYEGRQVTMEDFNAGNVAFMPLTFAEYRTYKTYPYKIKKYRNFRWDCVTFPAGPQGGNLSEMDTLLMGINKMTEHEQLAWEFLKLLTYDEEIQMDIFRYSQGASVLKEVTSSDEAEAILQADMEDGEKVIDSKLLSRILEDGKIVPKFKKYEQALSLSENMISKMMEEDNDIESSLKVLQKTIEAYLKQ